MSDQYIDLAKPKSRACIFFFSLQTSRAQHLALARTRTQVIRLGAQCSDHWTTEQSCDIGVPAVQLTTHVKRSTLYGRTVVRLYIQIFSAWWVTTTILYNYGAYALRAPLLVVPYCATIFFKKWISFYLLLFFWYNRIPSEHLNILGLLWGLY